MQPPAHQLCPECGQPLPGNAPLGLCPRCVLRQSFALEEEPAPNPELNPGGTSLDAASPAGSFGTFAGYELLRELGRGGMGVVYQARQPSLNRTVALKLILPNRLASPADIQRFQREAETTARLDHPHILPIYEVGECDGQPFFTMKYVEGGSLAARMAEYALPAAAVFERQSRMERRRQQIAVAGMVKKVAEAVAHAHQSGVLHRDLKPGNILLDAGGEPFVADFGLAKWLDQDAGLTLSRVGIGTPGYAAPEQLGESDRRQTTAADVYGIGAILYELLTGRVPFRKSTTLATLKAVLEEPPKPPHQIVPGLDPDLETICLKCLEKDPRQRYQTAAELDAELGRFIDGRPVLARPVSTSGRVARWCRRKPALAGSMAVAALVLVAGFVGVLWQWRRAEAHAQALRQESYYSGITLADFYIEQGDISRALEELLECPPEHRDWEWGYLMYRCHQDALSIPAHTDIELAPREIYVNDAPFLNTLSFDASGNLLATLGRDGRLKVWSSEDGRQLTSFGDAANPVTAFAFGARSSVNSPWASPTASCASCPRPIGQSGLPSIPRRTRCDIWLMT
jgi:eukaryotic-like serine/threonine-protein kinase